LASLLLSYPGKRVLNPKNNFMKTKQILIGSVLIVCIAIITTAFYNNSINYTKGVTNHTIKMQNSAFVPASLTVTKGSSVTWTNDDNTVHTVTATDGSFSSGDIVVGTSYTRTFTTAGTINYYDAHNNNMKGVLVVSDSTRKKSH